MVLDFLKEDFSVNALEFPPRKILGIQAKKVAKNSLYILIEEDRFFPLLRISMKSKGRRSIINNLS